MHETLNILFLTKFDEASYGAIPAAAHLMAEVRSTLSIMHVYEKDSEREDAERNVSSFFAEAEHYPGCRRFAVQGRLEDVVEQYWAAANIDLIMAPSVRLLDLPKPFRSSARARLLERIPAPLWTMTTRGARRPFCGPIRRVGCYVNFENDNLSHVHAAVQMARQLRAQLRLLCVTPTIHEGTLLTALHSDAPLNSKVAEERLGRLINSLSPDAAIFVETGDETSKLRELAERSQCDVLFLGENQALTQTFTGRATLRRMVSHLPCPAICLDGASRNGARWIIEPRYSDERSENRRSLLAVNF